MTNKEAIDFGKDQLDIFGKESQMSEFINLAIRAIRIVDLLEEGFDRRGYSMVHIDDWIEIKQEAEDDNGN